MFPVRLDRRDVRLQHEKQDGGSEELEQIFDCVSHRNTLHSRLPLPIKCKLPDSTLEGSPTELNVVYC